MQHVTFLINGIVDTSGRMAEDLRKRCEGVFSTDIRVSAYPGHIIELAEQAVQNGTSHLVIVGGDGTVNEGVNGLLNAFLTDPATTPSPDDLKEAQRVSFGVIPAGTGNDFCRFAGFSSDPADIIRKILDGKTRTIDVGWASFMDRSGRPTQRFFVNITDLGMGGETVQRMERKSRFLSSNLNYMKAILETFIRYDKTKVQCNSGDFRFEGPIMSLVVANGRYFGSGLGIAPEARMDDGFFEVVILGNITIWDYLKNLTRVRKSQIIEHPEVSYHRFSHLNIRSTDGSELPIDMDGDFAGFAPINLHCLPSCLSIIQ